MNVGRLVWITVPSGGEIRLKEGSYLEEAKRLALELKEDEGDDRFLFENGKTNE